jgi:hypothetical protein
MPTGVIIIVLFNITHSSSGALLEKLPVAQLLKNFLEFYGT